MRIQFLQVTESGIPGYPFLTGQVIVAPVLTPEMRSWIRSGHALILDDEPELATMGTPERAVPRKGRRR